MNTEKKKISVHILIGGGTPCAIELDALPVIPASDICPIQVQFVEDVSLSVKESFSRAAFAVYFLLLEKRWVVPGKRYAFLCQVKDEQGNDVLNQIIGRSLEFPVAIALIALIVRNLNIFKTPNHITIGATGLIADTAKGTIGPVDLLEKKLIGAVDAFDSNAIIFFPFDNQYEPIQSLHEKAQSKNIRLIAVKNMKQTVECFLPARTKPVKKILLMILILLMVYSLCYVASAPLITILLEYGKYDTAQKYLRASQSILIFNKQLNEFRKDFENNLDLTVSFYRLSQEGFKQPYPYAQKNLIMNRYDSFDLNIKLYLSQPTVIYLYIFQVDEYRHVRIIGETDNAVVLKKAISEKSASFKFPPNSKQTYIPTGANGKVETYIIASAWRCKDIETILSESKPDIESIRERAVKIKKFREGNKGPVACEKIEYEQILNGK